MTKIERLYYNLLLFIRGNKNLIFYSIILLIIAYCISFLIRYWDDIKNGLSNGWNG